MAEKTVTQRGISRAGTVRVLARRVEGLAGDVSASGYRQLRIVVRMWERALFV
ncbi:hypothetical protein GA0115240_12047 [Streptomyces sp. DvalAA-14]|uniref:hypothetical protein n=1 Tax=unclassified Streptomyces TaxID=2593676 RepID=UPI00081B34C5|nr:MULTISPECIES: hypothetical protein [unclassified Streptomyces]MYS20485.1 hypothetical protein [Streptomyces sp. SID4948]SCD70085.1 hypothetical protein GA0115240_12047 [Streptomyces sp. DvalAA-14]